LPCEELLKGQLLLKTSPIYGHKELLFHKDNTVTVCQHQESTFNKP